MHRAGIARHDRAAIAHLLRGERVAGERRVSRALAVEARRDVAGVEAVARRRGIDRFDHLGHRHVLLLAVDRDQRALLSFLTTTSPMPKACIRATVASGLGS